MSKPVNSSALRDRIAMKALHALIIGESTAPMDESIVRAVARGIPVTNAADAFASASYALADAMLAAREHQL